MYSFSHPHVQLLVGVSFSGCEGGWSLKLITRFYLMLRLKIYGIVSTVTHMTLYSGFYLNTEEQQISVFLVRHKY
jgi:hypothetical protein